MKILEKTIDDLINKQEVSFISSVDKNGYPNTKAMIAPFKREGIKTFFWHTNSPSMKVKEFRANNKACVYFYCKDSFSGVTFKGIMEVLDEEKSKKDFWNDSYSKWYQDNDFIVIKFIAESCRYYSGLNTEDLKIE
ncbi:MAG: pyridoxamine 5'-phosphate oxidase family protein [Oscillospiraceae bacterium]|jgi:general stress protein 26|nr:pyridoxamine 5'-phosphate oxidase family protein [Oscillospiraceae bacterium]